MKKNTRTYPLDAVSFMVWFVGSALGKTWDFAVQGCDDLNPFKKSDKGRIYCLWHSHLLPMAYLFRHSGKTAIISESSDGRRAAAIAERWGSQTIPGSSSHGGTQAIRSSLRVLQQGGDLVITPDGPRGPREIAKPGVAQIALLSGSRIVPLAALPADAWHLQSWDGFCIPKPFTYIDIRVREAIDPADFKNTPDAESALLKAIQQAMTIW